MITHHREVMRHRIRYARQERAYADAMADWRLQVIACTQGKTAACTAPTPNPEDYR